MINVIEGTAIGSLYARSDTFCAMIRVWDTQKQCPYGLVDLLLEEGLDGPAAAARWAATQPQRPVMAEDGQGKSHPYPGVHEGHFRWFTTKDLSRARDVPEANIPEPYKALGLERTETVTEALLWLLEYWRN